MVPDDPEAFGAELAQWLSQLIAFLRADVF